MPELSSTGSTEINLPFITADQTGPKHLNVKRVTAGVAIAHSSSLFLSGELETYRRKIKDKLKRAALENKLKVIRTFMPQVAYRNSK